MHSTRSRFHMKPSKGIHMNFEFQKSVFHLFCSVCTCLAVPPFLLPSSILGIMASTLIDKQKQWLTFSRPAGLVMMVAGLFPTVPVVGVWDRLGCVFCTTITLGLDTASSQVTFSVIQLSLSKMHKISKIGDCQ